jgi:FeS assembly SUF system regulator
MFRLNRLTDYAVVLLTQMARRPAELRSAQQIASEGSLPLPTVAKLLNALARDGIVASHRGAAGGYQLGRPAAAVSMADIVQALEGPIALTACVEGSPEACVVETLCPMAGNWNRVNQAIREALASVSLAEMAGSTAAHPPPSLNETMKQVAG